MHNSRHPTTDFCKDRLHLTFLRNRRLPYCLSACCNTRWSILRCCIRRHAAVRRRVQHQARPAHPGCSASLCCCLSSRACHDLSCTRCRRQHAMSSPGWEGRACAGAGAARCRCAGPARSRWAARAPAPPGSAAWPPMPPPLVRWRRLLQRFPPSMPPARRHKDKCVHACLLWIPAAASLQLLAAPQQHRSVNRGVRD